MNKTNQDFPELRERAELWGAKRRAGKAGPAPVEYETRLSTSLRSPIDRFVINE